MSGLPRVAIVFDMDGVLVDSVPALYEAYVRFMRQQRRVGTRAGFAALNGPRVEEIVAILARRHGLSGDRARLVELYRNEIDRAHAAVEPVPGVRELIDGLRRRGIPLAVASSAPAERVRATLARLGLLDAFGLVLSGDEVARAKPHPEIYERVRERLPAARHVVVEDAPNGIRAAIDAGLYTVQLRGAGDAACADAARVVDSMPALARILPGLLHGYRIEARADSIEILLAGEAPPLPASMRRAVDALWARECAARPELRDGSVLGHARTLRVGRTLRIEARAWPYRVVLAALRDPALGIAPAPLGVSGAVRDVRGRLLVGRRGAVTEYPGWLELVPSGGLPAPERPGPDAPLEQLLAELAGETRIPREAVNSVVPLGLVRDELSQVLDVGAAISLHSDGDGLGDALARGDEYTETFWLGPDELEDAAGAGPVVPASLGLLELLRGAKPDDPGARA